MGYDLQGDDDDEKNGSRNPMCLTKVCIGLTAFFGVLILSTALAGSLIIDAVVTEQIHDRVNIDDENSEFFEVWANPSQHGVDIRMTFALWNITNPDDILDGATPELDLVGPWTYIERRTKHSFRFNKDKSVVYYKENRTFTYLDVPCAEDVRPIDTEANCSVAEDLEINTINIPYMTVVNMVPPFLPDWMGLPFFMAAINTSLSEEDKPLNQMFIKRTMPQIVFGYDDPLLHALSDMLTEYNITGVHIPPYEIIANNSIDGRTKESAVQTRSRDGAISDFEMWQGNEKFINIWDGCDEAGHGNLGRHYNDLANMINGSEGVMVNPPVTSDTRPYLFVGDLQRSSQSIYNGTSSLMGVSLLRFVIEKEAMMTAKENPYNCAFSSYGFSGVMNMTAAYTAPIFASKPFFLDGDPDFLKNLSRTYVPEYANRETTDTFLDVEPVTGAIMRARLKLQLNLQIAPIPTYPRMAQLSHFYLPFGLLIEGSTYTAPLIDQYNAEIGNVLEAAGYYEAIGPFVGVVLLTISLLLVVVVLRRSRMANDEEHPLIGRKGGAGLNKVNIAFKSSEEDFLFRTQETTKPTRSQLEG